MEPHDPIADFPAAHSMDSGWFAVDKNGKLAHFDTGEAGAIPEAVTYATGEAGTDQGDELWELHVAPWIARNTRGRDFPPLAERLALFDTEANAAAAVQALGEDLHAQMGYNPLLVEVVWQDADDYWDPIQQQAGFIGFAPSFYSLWEDGVAELLPIAKYDHGDWAIPGNYVRPPHLPQVTLDGLPDDITRMDVDFGEAQELNLADFYSDTECASWSQANLRTGEMPPRPPSLMQRLKTFFKG